MNLSDREKIESVFLQLRERYTEARQMRDRSERFVIWISGLSFGLAGLLLLRRPELGEAERVALTCTVVAVGGMAIWHVLSMWRGYRRNHRLRIHLETIIGAYLPDEYVAKKTLLPQEYGSLPKRLSLRWGAQHFVILVAWLVVLIALLLVLVLSTPISETETKQAGSTAVQVGSVSWSDHWGGECFGQLPFSVCDIS